MGLTLPPSARGRAVRTSKARAAYGAPGSTVDELLSDHPSLTREDVHALLGFTAESMPQETAFAAA